MPRPVPFLALTPMLGIKVSKMLKVAAAVNAINPISITFIDCLGMAKVATAKTKP